MGINDLVDLTIVFLKRNCIRGT